MTNGNKQQSLLSNPLVLFLVGVGVALIVAVLAVVVLQPEGLLKTAAYPSSSTTGAPAKDVCSCTCGNPGDYLVCPVKPEGGTCSDYRFDFDITDSDACEAKENQSCQGYDVKSSEKKYGKLGDCAIVAIPKSSPSTTP